MADFRDEKMQVFVNFPTVEEALRGDIDERVNNILLTEAKNGERPPVDVIDDYLCHNDCDQRLKTLIGLSGGSLERLKRSVFAILGNSNWPNLRVDDKSRKIIAEFLVNPDDFADKVPEFIRRCFYLREDWVKSLRDRKQVTALVINSLKSDYAVKCGFAQEDEIKSKIDALGIPYEKGYVTIVNNKEVDVAIPSIENPAILIMSSYQLTTASAQSARANEQTLMYDDIQRHNRRNRNSPDVKLWNVIDGGGWMSRKNDLQKIIDNADRNFCVADVRDGTFAEALKEHFEN